MSQKMWCSTIFLVLQIVCLTYTHPDCNHKRVMDQFFYMCNSYTSNSIKREATIADGSGILFKLPPSDGGFIPAGQGPEPVIQTPQTVSNPGFGTPPGPQDYGGAQPQQPLYPPTPQFPWVDRTNNLPSFSVPFQDPQDTPRRKGNLRVPTSAAIPNEPEDFASFNNWYLNPVYADADWPSAIERWRRKSYINEEIWRFVRNRCCVTGCPFPEDYLELDKRVNICGMR